MSPRTYLFVPGTRLDRVERAWASGCDAVIVDLEDAVAEDDKAGSREALVAEAFHRPVYVRINPRATPFHDADLRAVSGVGALAGVVVPMVESPDDIAAAAEVLPAAVDLIALVETPLGLRRIDDILASPSVSRVAFGSADYCAALAVERSAGVLAHPRSVLAVAASAADLPAPIDGPYLALDDEVGLREDVLAARMLGLRSKLCIHPRQVATVRTLLRPSEDDVRQAQALLAAAETSGGGAFRWQGTMVDAPVLTAARQVVADAEAAEGP